MKHITVYIEAFFGYSHTGSHSANQTFEIEVSDEVAASLQVLMDAAEPDEDGVRLITTEEVVAAIENGHDELQPLHDELCERFYYMDEEYWIEQAKEDCLEPLEEAFDGDVEDGLYEPELDMTDDDSESTDEPQLDFDHCRDHYFDWVVSHDDHEFLADRLGVDLGVCRDDEPYYCITQIF